MTKVTTNFGEPLSVESKKLVNDVRLRTTQPLCAESRKEIVDHAVKTLNQHLRLRKCMRLDELRDIPFEENTIFKDRYMPCGEILTATDCFNRLLWFIEYATISVEGIAHSMKSSEAIRYQFWQFEHMLRKVNKQEEKSGKLSSLRHIVDMNGYEINPFTMLFVSSGTLSYYSQLFHYENYPELVNPIELVNIAKWIQVPYKLIKAMMPAGFSDRFRLHDGNFLQYLTSEISIEDIPTTLGGNNEHIKCIPSDKRSPSKYWQPSDEIDLPESLETIHISPRKSKNFRISVDKENYLLNWYFRTDGDVYFGVFYEPLSAKSVKDDGKDVEWAESKEMVYPWLKLSAKLYHEYDALLLTKPGTYEIVFCNRHCWLNRRTIDIVVHLTDAETNTTKRHFHDGSQEIVPSTSINAKSQFLNPKTILQKHSPQFRAK
ncbi:CRAL/TRIO domain-containing protein [Ditylenchus destructor]|uniref:CRAL/TRIO domain-containing protein n=1 Tax=Ditylenchus destructor TaxID=166010 RepID=A0AAD4QWT6_9BILA|nr:CRAL/TRIO domain-containing protein [Ditylenchus destructor]